VLPAALDGTHDPILKGNGNLHIQQRRGHTGDPLSGGLHNCTTRITLICLLKEEILIVSQSCYADNAGAQGSFAST
jgi:hypothetical protein